MERTYGTKALATDNLSLKEIAKLVRSDIKAAVLAGDLPDGIKVSVRCEFYSMGQSLHVNVTQLPEGFGFISEYVRHEFGHLHRRPTEKASVLIARLEKIVNAYNYDGSDSSVDYFDVRFYGHVRFAWKLEQELTRNLETAAR